MKIHNLPKRPLGLFCALLLMSFSSQVAWSQDDYKEKNAQFEKELESTSQLIVMLSVKFAGSPDFGSGIIVGREKDRIFIATAYHVIHRGADHPVVGVTFKFDPKRELVAKLLKYDEAMDLAVLSVEKLASERINPCALKFERLGDFQALSRGSGVFALGNPKGVNWASSADPEKVSRINENEIVFQSTFIRAGHSGGPLLDENGLIVGMTVADQEPFGRAANISVVLPKVRQWGYPVQLGPSLENGMTVLHQAVVNKDVVAINNLLADCGPNVTDGNKATPLHYAAGFKSPEIAALLIKAGADLNALDEDGVVPLGEAIQFRNFEIVKILVKAGAKLDTSNYSALVHAAKVDQHEMVVFLLQNGARVNAQPGGFETALHYAVMSNQLETVRTLLKAGARLDLKSTDGRTAFHAAVMGHEKSQERREIVTLLIKAGARGDTIAANGKSPLHEAVEYRDLETLRQLLATRINVDIRQGGSGENDRTALHIAVSERFSRFEPEIMQALIKAGANVNARTGEGETPIHLAVFESNTEAIKGLIQAGADVNAKDRKGRTALQIATENGSSVVDLLRQYGGR